jgi:carbamoylphosphate synthase large subunit
MVVTIHPGEFQGQFYWTPLFEVNARMKASSTIQLVATKFPFFEYCDWAGIRPNGFLPTRTPAESCRSVIILLTGA